MEEDANTIMSRDEVEDYFLEDFVEKGWLFKIDTKAIYQQGTAKSDVYKEVDKKIQLQNGRCFTSYKVYLSKDFNYGNSLDKVTEKLRVFESYINRVKLTLSRISALHDVDILTTTCAIGTGLNFTFFIKLSKPIDRSIFVNQEKPIVLNNPYISILNTCNGFALSNIMRFVEKNDEEEYVIIDENDEHTNLDKGAIINRLFSKMGRVISLPNRQYKIVAFSTFIK